MQNSSNAAARGDSTSTPASTSRELPVNSRWFTRFFAAYSQRLVRKHFHAVRLLGAPDLSAFAGRPLVIYANHPSWWDPLIALVVWRRLLGDRVPYAPIDAAMLKKYAFFKRLAEPPKPKTYGVIHDIDTHKPVKGAVVRVLSLPYHKVLETRLTDAQGRYAFNVGAGLYYLTALKPGYEKTQTDEIDFTKNAEPAWIASDLPMRKARPKLDS